MTNNIESIKTYGKKSVHKTTSTYSQARAVIAIENARRGNNLSRPFSSVEELMADLNADE